jgi:hypothetical protein
MLPNHARFIEAIQHKNQVRIRFYSAADSGVLDRVCAPLDYGPGPVTSDGLNRYWILDCAATPTPEPIGLVPQQILDLHVLGSTVDAAVTELHRWTWSIPPAPPTPPHATPLTPVSQPAPSTSTG